MLQVFVYGTLMRGYANHRRLCRGVRFVVRAWVAGRLYRAPAGYPVLVTPSGDHWLAGTGDAMADVRRLAAVGAPSSEAGGIVDGPVVEGELLTFDDAVTRLPRLDRLEGFNPGGRSEYQRVAGRVETARGPAAAWYYVGERAWAEGALKRIADRRWRGGPAWR